ncbi:TPA: hypothetical protein IDY85_003958 [Escherichia coli]|nr:hypothetical protein [Escherichia coli]
MAVQISGVLKDGAGKPIQGCTIQLKAKRNSTTVVVNTVASENPDEAGRYSMDVEYGQYSVILLVEGFPPSHAGTITVYEDSKPGTLNDFLGAATEDDLTPEMLRRFYVMVEEVARNASVAAQNTAAAKKSASDASASAAQAATHATGAAGSARAASTSAGQAASSAQSASSSAGTASTKATEASKSAVAAESSKNAAATSAGAAKTSEMNAAASQKSAATSASTATTKASEAATSARDASASKEAAKSSETSAASSASSTASSATAAGNSAKAAKTSEANARASETAATQSASAAAGSKAAAASSAGAASTSAGQAAVSATAAGKSAESAASSASTATTKAAEATAQASTAARSASAAKTSETNAKASEVSAAYSKTAAASSASQAALSAQTALASKNETTRQASAAAMSASTASAKATEAAGSATAAAQSKSAAESAFSRASAAAGRAESIAATISPGDASLTKKGLVQLSSATNSVSETLAATAKAVKIAMDNANARLAKDRNGADIPNKPLFIQNVGLQETVNRAADAVSQTATQHGLRANSVVWIKTHDQLSELTSGACRFVRNYTEPGTDGDSGILPTSSYFYLFVIAKRDVANGGALLIVDIGDPSQCWVGVRAVGSDPETRYVWQPLVRDFLKKSGGTMTGKLILRQLSAFGVNTENALGGNSIVLGDNDTGFKQNGDGILDVYANSRHVLRFLSNSIYSFCDTNVSGNLNIRGDNRLHYIMRNNDDSVRMYIWKDKGGDAVRINNGIDGGGDFAFGKNGEFYSPGYLHAGGAVIAGDGNVYGTRWGGWLFDYLNRSFVRDIRLGALSSLTIWNGPGWSDRSGYVMTGAVNGNQDALVDTAQARPIQKYINGNWYNVGSL